MNLPELRAYLTDPIAWEKANGLDGDAIPRALRGGAMTRSLAVALEEAFGWPLEIWPHLEPPYTFAARAVHKGKRMSTAAVETPRPPRRGRHQTRDTALSRWMKASGHTYPTVGRLLGVSGPAVEAWNADRHAIPAAKADRLEVLSAGAVTRASFRRVRP